MDKPDFGYITRLYAKASGGNEAALHALYEIALQTLPKRSGDSRSELIQKAALKVLNDATTGDHIWADEDLNITLPDFKASVARTVEHEASYKTVDRFFKKWENLQAIALKYVAANGGFKSE